MSTLRVVFCLPGLHRVGRGAEVALESVAAKLALAGDAEVTLIGSGEARAGDPYRFLHAGCIPRERFERWPALPVLRSDTHYEELSFVPGFLSRFRPADYDVVVTCSYPFLNWAIRGRVPSSGPAHVFVTQNGDWPLHRKNSEFRSFSCDAVVCTNPDYYDAHEATWRCRLIPNGVDTQVFFPGSAERARFGLPERAPVILMVSALIPSKRVLEGVRAAAGLDGAHLMVAGDGPLRDEVDRLGRELLGERFHRATWARADMPALYRCADAFLHMSLEEPSANAYLEALATGLPVVTHDRRVTRWTLEPHGLFADANDLAAVTRALGTALERGRDDAAVVEAGRRFSWTSIAGEYASFFREVLAARAA